MADNIEDTVGDNTCTAVCKECVGGVCVNVSDNTQDTAGDNVCNATCKDDVPLFDRMA